MEQIAILVVDDEKEIADLVEIYLVSDGYKVFKANNAKEGLEILEKEEIHLVLLDIMMPGMDGLEMCRKTGDEQHPDHHAECEINGSRQDPGLGTGADDYVVKPFNPLELTARVKSQLRRYNPVKPEQQYRKGGKERDHDPRTLDQQRQPQGHRVRGGDQADSDRVRYPVPSRVESGPACTARMKSLRRCGTKKYTRQTIPSWYIIRRLRGKMKEDTRQDKIITTVWGVGYKIEK